MGKKVIGLDIGTHSVHVSELTAGRGGEMKLTNFGVAVLPEHAVRDGEIQDVASVGATIRHLLHSTGISGRDVVLGVANQRVFVRQIDVPWMSEAELRSSLSFQVQEHLPIPVEEAELDFYVLDEPIINDQKMARVLLVGAQRDMVQSHVDSALAAGLTPTAIDLNALALLRVLKSHQPVVGDSSEVLIDIGAGVTNVVIHEGGIPRFARTLVSGGEELTRALMSEFDMEPSVARKLKHETGLQSDPADEVASVIARRAYHFLDEIRGSLDYYRAQGGAQFTQVVLCGGGSLLPGLADRLEAELRLPVVLGNPLQRMLEVSSTYTDEQLRAVEPVLATSIGLAMGGLL